MSFIELPNGELINPDNIRRVEPLRSGSVRIHFSDVHAFDVQEEHTKVLRKALIPPKTKTPRIVKNKEKSP